MAIAKGVSSTGHEWRQLRVCITPWKSGHCTVDIVVRSSGGTDHWDRRAGHIDLDISPDDLAGLSPRDVLTALVAAPVRP